jgi:hypothetical protein
LSDIKFDDRNILHKAVPFIIHREIIERKLVTPVVPYPLAQKSASSGTAFSRISMTTFIRQRIAQSVNDHLVRHINKRTVIVGYTGTGMHKNWSEIILDVAYSGETSGKALFIPSPEKQLISDGLHFVSKIGWRAINEYIFPVPRSAL